ncbi:DNA-directed RNA polymerase III subunit RPC6 [Melia azedarach]|uniref:DNA-directed RNA polymerase III subunit RPC6 n=1 Tax=Melia azedarach TaxID=155640 RepID=A0ACC1XZN7_MELAZ|nr:DNA-directed RNA polymerase III subunit RPC6 [Melia azedarach]
MSKRKRPDSNTPADALTEHEHIIYDVIRSKQDMGIWTRDMKRELQTNIPDNIVTKSLKSLQAKKLIKEVVNIQNKGRKHFMAVEFKPSKEISGGAWYVEGNLDTDFIKVVKDQCIKHINRLKVATLEGITDSIKRSGVFKDDLTKQQIEEIVRALVLDDEILEVKSNGSGEFANIPVGKICYKSMSRGSSGGGPKLQGLASVPCGVCPQINLCTPDGIISPKTCVYYTKWLDF